MITLLALLALATIEPAPKPAPAYCLVKCNKKPKVKPAPKPTPKVEVKVVEEKPCCAPSVTVNTPVTVNVGQAQAQQQEQKASDVFLAPAYLLPNWRLGLRGAGGTALCAPTGIGLLGVRVNYLPIHLGLDIYTEFYWGTGAQLLVYPIQTYLINWHINGGVIMFSNNRPFVTPNLPRNTDLTLGTGLEFHVLPFLWLTADLQARMVNLVALKALGADFGTTLGQSLMQTQVMLGVMVSTW